MFISMRLDQTRAGNRLASARGVSPHSDPMTTFPSLESYLEWCEINEVEADPAVIETCLQRLMDEHC
jgi:hypothetical protein